MDLLELITKYWSILGFIFVAIASWVKYSQSLSDLKLDMQKQKEEHDTRIVEVQSNVKEVTIRLEAHKDKTTELMNTIQQDIREIMTILKGNIINK